MFINFTMFVACTFAAIWQGVNGNLRWCLVEIAFALMNLPYAIKWLKEYFED